MAQAQTLRFGQFLLQLGDGLSPETFTAPCGLTARSFSRKTQTSDTNVPDCDDPDAPSWLESDIVGYSVDITGSGVIDDADYATWETWAESGDLKNVKITLNTRQWIIRCVLAELTITGSKGPKVTYNISLKGSGAPAYTP